MKEKLKRKQGITLITLVITIVILLILAGIAIASLTGDNGLFKRAKDARNNTKIADEKEKISLAYNGSFIDEQTQRKRLTAKTLEEELKLNGIDAAVIDNGDDTLSVTFDSWNEYEVDNEGNITGPTQTNIFASIKIKGEEVTTPPLPDEEEFSYKEGSLDTGYVIQDKEGNEFVWVPVDKNQKIEINIKSKEENIKSITLTDPYGDDILTESDQNKDYSNTDIEPTINGPYILEINTESERKVVVLSVHSLYAVDSYIDLTYSNEYLRLMGFDGWDEFLEMYSQQLGYDITREDFFKELIKSGFIKKDEYLETKNNFDSINNAGGFYIGRYEASYENGNAAVKKSKIADSNTSVENGKLWNGITYEEASQVTEKMYEDIENKNFESSILTAASWDRTLDWLYETGEKSAFDIMSEADWGNTRYNLINTGSVEKYKANNIYDIWGNLFEWTTEKSNEDNSQVYRGGNLNIGLVSGGPYWKSTDFDGNGYRIGFRPAIYLNN